MNNKEQNEQDENRGMNMGIGMSGINPMMEILIQEGCNFK